MFGHLAADQSTARLPAPGGDTRHQGFHHLGVQRAHRHVVEEEERLGALTHEVVDAHRDEVHPDGVESPSGGGHERLGTDAIGRRDQQRIGVSRRRQIEHSAETTDPAEHAWTRGRSDDRLDPLHRGFTRLDVDAGVAIAGAGHVSRPAAIRSAGANPRRRAT